MFRLSNTLLSPSQHNVVTLVTTIYQLSNTVTTSIKLPSPKEQNVVTSVTVSPHE
jgi:hypothetical protein